MAKKTTKKTKKESSSSRASTTSKKSGFSLRPKNKYVESTLYFLATVFLIMSAVDAAGNVGSFLHEKVFLDVLGSGFFLLPLGLGFMGYRAVKEIPNHIRDKVSLVIVPLSTLGIIDVFFSSEGTDAAGAIGSIIGNALVSGFDIYFSSVLLIGILLVGMFILLDPKLNALKNIKESIDDKLEGNSSESDEDDTINTQVNRAIQQKKSEDPPEEKKSFSIPNLIKKHKEEEDIVMDAGTNFASSYESPPLSLLAKSGGKPSTGDIKANANIIQRTLANFGIAVEMDEISIGPTVTRYAMKPAQGVRLAKIASLQNELALALAAKSIRIEAPIPGRSLVGIEVPNTQKSKIGLGSILAEPLYQNSDKPLLVSLGKGVSGKSHFANLAKMPHALIAGATGSGKSVTINNIIMSLLYKNGPDMLRFIMVDPKRVELTLYKKIPHLLTPVITDPKKAVLALKWAVKEMERRYDALQKQAVRDIDSYHNNIVAPAYKNLSEEEIENRAGDLPEKMPYIVVVIDELSDIMSSYPRELEAAIVRLAQMSRAVGIHLILATQRPSVNVITGLIKANVPTRMALKVASQIDSRTIIDKRGAEKLLGQGDMLYQGEGSNEPIRVQCPFVSEDEVKKVVAYIQKNYKFELGDTIDLPDENISEGAGGITMGNDSDDDPMVEEARLVVMQSKKASTSYLQRRLSIGYSRAARIIDLLEERGVIGPANGSKPRDVFVEEDDEQDQNESQPEEENTGPNNIIE